MEEEPIQLELEILAEYTTDDDIFNLGSGLYKTLHDNRDVDTVDRIRMEQVPEGTKVGDPITLGALAIAVLPTALPSLFSLVQGWVTEGKGKGRTVKFKNRDIDFEGSPEDLDKLLAKLEKSKKKKK